jgi:catalase
VCPFHNFQRDGIGRQLIAQGRVSYEPNSLAAGTEFRVEETKRGFQSYPEAMESPKVRQRSPTFFDHFSQARLFWNSQTPSEKDHIVSAFRFELSKVETVAVRQRMVDNLAHVDEKLARKVAEPLGIGAPDAKAAAGRPGFREHEIKLPVDSSKALSMEANADGGIATRKIAVLVADGVDSASFKPVQDALEKAGAQCKFVAPHLGTVKTSGGRAIPVDFTLQNMPSIMFDAVLVPAGAGASEILRADGDAVHYVLEAFKHCKAICALGEGVELLRTLGITLESASVPGVIVADAGKAGRMSSPQGNEVTPVMQAAQDFVKAIGHHRFWDRPGIAGVPA